MQIKALCVMAVTVLGLVLIAVGLDGCGRGNDGVNGTNASPCAAAYAADGIHLSCPGTNEVVLPYAQDGQDGEDGKDAIQQIIDPCGDAAGIYDEVILKLNTGQLLASFSDHANGDNTRFSLLVTGSYVTTDGSNCRFSVSSDGNVSW